MEWEYACRASTQTSTYVGEMGILGYNNAPLLDRIAWYGGNSGVGFELDEGADSAGWPEKQYPHTRAGTHPVAQKEPNEWGLYEMLGNVWEWCAGREGSRRVFRGGSWYSVARFVRSASRYWFDPGGRDDFLGVRFARGQGE